MPSLSISDAAFPPFARVGWGNSIRASPFLQSMQEDAARMREQLQKSKSAQDEAQQKLQALLSMDGLGELGSMEDIRQKVMTVP